jgi:hypothetical protein
MTARQLSNQSVRHRRTTVLLLIGAAQLGLLSRSLPAFAQSLPASTDDQVQCRTYVPLDLISGDKPSEPVCSFGKEISQRCSIQQKNSIFSLCNVYDLRIGALETLVDDKDARYQALTLKASEQNNCFTQTNSLWGSLFQCDTFAVYARILRRETDQRCLALVASALLGTQLAGEVTRSNINLPVSSLQIPGVSRRILFSPSGDTWILEQDGARMISSNDGNRSVQRSGVSISPLYLLELESTLTIAADNLKPSPAKLRVIRSATDYSNFSLGRAQEQVLNSILSGCR